MKTWDSCTPVFYIMNCILLQQPLVTNYNRLCDWKTLSCTDVDIMSKYLFGFLSKISSVHPQASLFLGSTCRRIGSLSKDTDNLIALHLDALVKIGFSNASNYSKIPQTLALPVDDWCETSVFCRILKACCLLLDCLDWTTTVCFMVMNSYCKV